LSEFHRLVAEIALALGLLTTGWALLLLLMRRKPGTLFFANVAWTVGAAALAALLGVVMLLGGSDVHDSLHLIYGALAVAALPVAAIYSVGQPLRRRLLTWLGGGIVLLILVLRLFQTG
jgi:hypothetical protein